MNAIIHSFSVDVTWDGPVENLEKIQRRLPRGHQISAEGLEPILGSAAKSFHGDVGRWNPEQLIIAAVAQCHMMTFLFLANKAGIDVRSYQDSPTATLTMDPDGVGGELTSIVLAPCVQFASANTETDTDIKARVEKLHLDAPKYCFIARSIKTPVTVEPETTKVAS